uniref:Uncharacterized protein n=1 Tax=Micrurus spixii TaxID=129469 RepID=A0A2D4MHH7_9SAUR
MPFSGMKASFQINPKINVQAEQNKCLQNPIIYNNVSTDLFISITTRGSFNSNPPPQKTDVGILKKNTKKAGQAEEEILKRDWATPCQKWYRVSCVSSGVD